MSIERAIERQRRSTGRQQLQSKIVEALMVVISNWDDILLSDQDEAIQEVLRRTNNAGCDEAARDIALKLQGK